jgi:hypothetical protein
MSTQAEKLAAVEAAVKILAEIEAENERQQALYDQLIAAIAACHALEIGTQGQFLRIRSLFTSAKGNLAGALEKTIAGHEICTLAAKKADCDVVLPDAYAATGGVTVMGGGR